jgi:hypothetical protein
MVAIVTNAAGQTVTNATVAASDGLTQSLSRTDSSGRATINVTGIGDQDLIVFAGVAYTKVQLKRSRPPRQTVSLSLNATRPDLGTTVDATATVRDEQGRPIPGVSVQMMAVGPAGPIFVGPSKLTTDANGRAVARLKAARVGQAVITSVTGTSLEGAGAMIDWQSSGGRWSLPQWWPLAPALILTLALSLALARRRVAGSRPRA